MERLDEFSKLLAESVSRRESLRRIGTFVAGAVLSPLGLGTAWAARPDRCRAFCRWCSNKAQRNQCLAACRACNGNTSRLCGSCGAYVCCPTSVGLLQRDMHRCEFGSAQLRRLRKRLPRIGADLQPGDMQRNSCAGRYNFATVFAPTLTYDNVKLRRACGIVLPCRLQPAWRSVRTYQSPEIVAEDFSQTPILFGVVLMKKSGR